MRAMRNPFRLRASEQATSDEDFLALFGPKVLDILPRDEVWDRLLILASAPGAGKTTLLRLFTPGVLRALHATRQGKENRDLVEALESLDALGSQGPNVLGVYIDCREQYASIEDLPIDAPIRLRWFFELLDARVVLLTLKAALTLAGLNYPQDIDLVELRPRSDGNSSLVVDHQAGRSLYEQSSATEASICEALDSLRGIPRLPSEGRSRLQSLRWLGNSDVLVRGSILAPRVLVMFDDVQTLDPAQLAALRKDLEDRSLRVGRWISQRYQIISPPEVLAAARTEGRDYRYTKQFEDWARSTTFEKLVLDIASRRSRRAETAFQQFSWCLAETMAQGVDPKRIDDALEGSQRKVQELAGSGSRFSKWLLAAQDATRQPFEQAVRWRAVAILLQRELSRQQLALDLPLEAEDLRRRFGSEVDAAASLFLAREYHLPYYFGSRCLATLASFNIEQFLQFAGDLFDKVIASSTLAMTARQLTAAQQDSILREVSRRRLNALARDLPHGTDVQRLVNSIGALCQEETYRPTAPYAPGATGVAIRMQDRNLLCDPRAWEVDPGISRLFHVLASAVAHNILEPRPDTRFKGQDWLVLYLNRGLCPAFALPLHYGGIRERPLADLKRWLDAEYQPRPQTRMGFDR